MGQLIRGMAVSKGLTIGRVLKYNNPDIKYEQIDITNDEVNFEKERLAKAVQKSEQQLLQIQQVALKNIGKREAEIFEAHIMLLQDEEFIKKVQIEIEENLKAAPEAVTQVAEELAGLFSLMEDSYLQARAADIMDVSKRIIANILNIKIEPLNNLEDEVILVAAEISPSDIVMIDTTKIKAIVTEEGGPTSHAAIVARSLEIPGVLGCNNIMNLVSDKETLIIDGENGNVIINPDKEKLIAAKKEIAELLQHKNKLLKMRDLAAVSTDGCRIQLLANAGTLHDVKSAIKYGAEGIGLFRTEFMFMARKQAPTENEQFAIYKEIVQVFEEKPVTIRTLDIGGDKEIECFEFPEELNPFLGWRGIRFSLDNQELLKTQIRAILRASYYGNIKIMFPMVTILDDVTQAKNILKQAKEELLKEEIPFNNEIELGVMIETPAAALIVDKLAAIVDFFSIGSNDLIQYTMAADRTNKMVSSYYQPENIAIVRLLKKIIDAAHKSDISVGICGQMAADPQVTELLIGLGIDKLSMSPIMLPEIKDIIRGKNYTDCREVLQKKIL